MPNVVVPYVTPLINTVLMLVLDNIYTIIARRLTKWENHRTVWQYESLLATKLFWFKFLNSFCPLFWVAFVDRDAANLRKQLIIVMAVRQLWYMTKHNILPLLYVHQKWKYAGFAFNNEVEWYNADLQSEPASGQLSPLVHVQELMEQPDFLLGKQMEVIVQFGYITMFVSVLPIAPLLALINNIVNTRLDVITCTQVKKRPPFESETEVSTFMHILEFMSFAAIAVNCSVLFFTTRSDYESLLSLVLPEWVTSNEFYINKLWLLLVVEHAVLGAKALLALTIDDSPGWVQRESENPSDEEEKKRLLRETKKSRFSMLKKRKIA